MEEDGGASPLYIYLLVTDGGYSFPEYIFFYILVQVFLISKFKTQGYFDAGADMTHSSKKTSFSGVIAKPFILSVYIFFILLFFLPYVFFSAFIYSIILEQVPRLVLMLPSGQIYRPIFGLKKIIVHGTILISLIYLYCYSGSRNVELSNLEK
jgi:hypothetical protein